MSRPKQKCLVPDCDAWRVGQGYCDLHYRRFVKHGDPLVNQRPSRPDCCIVDGCGNEVKGRGLCSKHYSRQQKHGDVTTVLDNRRPRARRPMLDRFLEKARVVGECWIWQAAKDRRGYGRIGAPGGKWMAAHRYAAALRYGMFDQTLHVRHDCDTPACVNPAHLRLGTHAENMRDKVERGRSLGRPLGDRGRLPQDLIDAYVAAHRPRDRRPSVNPHDVQELRAQGLNTAAIAARFGVTTDGVLKIEERARKASA